MFFAIQYDPDLLYSRRVPLQTVEFTIRVAGLLKMVVGHPVYGTTSGRQFETYSKRRTLGIRSMRSSIPWPYLDNLLLSNHPEQAL